MPLDPAALTYALVFRDGTTIDEAAVLAAGGFAACTARDGFESFVVRDGDAPIAQVVIRDDLRPIFGRLWVTGIDAQTGHQYRYLRAVVYGWQRTVGGTNVKALTWVTEDGVYVADRDLEEIAAT